MNKRRVIFLSIFGVYELSIFIFSVIVENSDVGSLLNIFEKIHLIKYGALIGVAFLATEFLWTWMDSKNATKEKEAMRHENNVLKAKVYDLTNEGPSISK